LIKRFWVCTADASEVNRAKMERKEMKGGVERIDAEGQKAVQVNETGRKERTHLQERRNAEAHEREENKEERGSVEQGQAEGEKTAPGQRTRTTSSLEIKAR
jgi:hypothetical protein